MASWYDGSLFMADTASAASVPLDDVGLRFGATVFTTLRVYHQDLDHPLTQWQEHCNRLRRSIEEFGWAPPDWQAVRAGCQHLKAHFLILRVTVFPDGREWIAGRSLPPRLAAQRQTGIRCWVASPDYARSLPTHKTGNYLACYLARQQAQRHGADEAILTGVQGNWLETATGNLWGWAKGQWWTPMSSQCLPGLMRERLIQTLAGSGQLPVGYAWTPERVEGFEAIAYSNCAVELLPVHTIFSGTTTLEYNPKHASIRALQRQIAKMSSAEMGS